MLPKAPVQQANPRKATPLEKFTMFPKTLRGASTEDMVPRLAVWTSGLQNRMVHIAICLAILH
jgi:hypothetical protein